MLMEVSAAMLATEETRSNSARATSAQPGKSFWYEPVREQALQEKGTTR